MKISIVTPVYNSHKALRRQIKYYKRLKLPDDIEIIFIDDGSNPPLKFATHLLKNCRIYPTGDTRPWTQPCARNLGAKIAQGEYLLMTDIDHILPKTVIDAVYTFDKDKMEFPREFAILNNNGMIVQDIDTLVRYGYSRKQYRKRKFRIYKHTNTFAMRRKLFWEIGGYSEKRCDRGTHPTHDDLQLHSRYNKYAKQGKCSKSVIGPVTYCFPAVAADPKKLFHNLERGFKKQTFKVASIKNSIDHLASMMDKYSKVYYVRYGNGEWLIIGGNRYRRARSSRQLKTELRQSLLIEDDRFIRSTVLDLSYESGIAKKVFKKKQFKFIGKSILRLQFLEKIAARYTNEREFYNAVVFHYLATHNPDILIHFIDKYIKPKVKMFIGCNNKNVMESLYGKIDHYVQIPEHKAYYSLDEWWPDIKKNAKKCEVILASAGGASAIVQKRLWELDVNAHCVDFGSINDAIEGKESRGWIKRVGTEQLKRNLNV